jgi:3-hydroxypropanoate dehydrogenase
VPEELLVRIVEFMKLGPTGSNTEPARVVFVKSPEAKARLKPLLSEGNVEKTMTAPVTAIIGYDLAFYEKLAKLSPHSYAGAQTWFAENADQAQQTALQGGLLQGGYFIIAARALGLDCGPMSGFDAAATTAEFFAGTRIQANFLCNLGYGDASALKPRLPRLDFDEVATII